MAFENNLGGIRAFGRRMILPAEEMKNLIKTELLDKYPIRKVIDFGAGTLYWSDWFQEQFSGTGGGKVYPVDIIFKKNVPDTKMQCYASIEELPKEEFSKEVDDPVLFFICDVIHHLPLGEWEALKQKVIRQCRFIVVKDISCHYRFKNWMNRMHDRIINGEKIHDVDPDHLIADLRMHGYQCMYKNLHKLWYSHFIILAVKKSVTGQQ